MLRREVVHGLVRLDDVPLVGAAQPAEDDLPRPSAEPERRRQLRPAIGEVNGLPISKTGRPIMDKG